MIDRKLLNEWCEENGATNKYFGDRAAIYHRGEAWLVLKNDNHYEVRHGGYWGKLHTHHQIRMSTLEDVLNKVIKTHRPELKHTQNKVFRIKELLETV